VWESGVEPPHSKDMRFSRRLLLIGFAALAAAPVGAQTPSTLPPAVVSRAEAAIKAEMSRQNIPGLSVAVVAEGQLRWSAGYGFADLENQVPARAETVYRLASISKPITAVAVMQLAEAGKLDLDAPVQKYVPSFPQKQWPVTSRQLLGHLGGVRHYKGSEIGSTRRYLRTLDTLAIFKDDPLLHEPGTKYAYTTYGYNLLGAAVEGASGAAYLDYVREHIFKPAGMDRIRDDDAHAIIPNRAQGYRKNADGTLRNSDLADVSNKIPGGGFCSTVEDLARFAIAMQGDRLLKPATRTEMWTRQKLRDGSETTYGLGWSLGVRKERREVSHGGGQPRVATYLYTLPDQRCAVVLMTNLEGAQLPGLARQIADAVLAE
jgi:CubicO group peptidase (beta-lactamase class C family)